MPNADSEPVLRPKPEYRSQVAEHALVWLFG